MLSTFLGEIAGASPEQIAKMRSDPDGWVARLRNAPTVPRELRVEEHYVFSPPRFVNMRTPTLLMVGGNSPNGERESADAVAGALPDGRVVVLQEQGHLAMYGDPDLFVREIVRFVAS